MCEWPLCARSVTLLFFFFFSPVARNTVGLSVRRHSTAAALAQNAAPETQENRWDTHSTAPALYRKHPPWLEKKIKNPCVLVLAAVLCFFLVLSCTIVFKCFFFVFFTQFGSEKQSWDLLIGRPVPNTHPLGGILCSRVLTRAGRSVCVCQRDSKKMEK